MNVLLTSVGRRSYLVRYFREALRGTGRIIATNTHADAPGMYAADEGLVVPAAHQPNYVDAIEAICRERQIGLLCSLHDLDVFVLAQHRERLAATGAIPVLPDPDWGKVSLDKFECGLRLQSCGWAVPWTSISLEETKTALAAAVIRFPLIVKARFGFGSLGLHRCSNLRELESWNSSVREELRHTVIQQFWPVPEHESVLFQEFVEGPEYCVDVVNNLEGRYVAHFAGEVHAMRAGESDSMTTVDPGFVGDLPLRLSQLTRHRGIWGLDLIVRGTVPTIIDINPRFTGDYPFQHIAGANIPAALLAWAQGVVPEHRWLHPAVGVRGYKDINPVRAG